MSNQFWALYLNKSGELKKTGEEKLLNLKFYGGEQVTTFTLGIPHSKLQVMTDFEDVTEIINDISSQTGSDLNALLLGFGTTGNTVGKIGGGFTSAGKFGSAKALQSLASGGNVSLFYNFDILRYSESGKGVSDRSAAYTALNEKNYLYEYDIVTAEQDPSGLKYLYVTRDKLVDLAQKANKAVQSMKIDGVCFDTMTYQTYSDYRSNLYNSKSSTYKQVSYILKQSAKEGLQVASVSANIYAALESVNVYDVPTSSAKYQVYDVDVPFYQMVLKGYVPMSVYSVNLSENSQKALLNAVETGLGLTYTLIDEYDTSLIYSADNIYFNSVYDDVKDLIISQTDTYKEVFKEVKGSPIAGHELINKNVRAKEIKFCIDGYNYCTQSLTSFLTHPEYGYPINEYMMFLNKSANIRFGSGLGASAVTKEEDYPKLKPDTYYIDYLHVYQMDGVGSFGEKF